MAVRTDDGGLGRRDLARSLARLSQQYAGTGLPYTEIDGRIIGGERSVSPVDLPGLGPLLTGTRTAALPPQPPGAPGPGSTGPYDLAGDGGAWRANGVNEYNEYLARGDMPAPGPVGRGPGFWILDDFGTPFWRSDWEQRGGQWFIRGET